MRLLWPPPPPPPPASVQPQTSTLAIAGLIFSFFCGLLGLVLCASALSEIKRSNGTLKGEELANVGLAISIISTVLGLFVLASR